MGNRSSISKKNQCHNQAHIPGNHRSIPLPLLRKIVSQYKYACKIINENILGTGFFCRIHLIPVLITCNHVFDSNFKEKIHIKVDERYYDLLLDNQRFIYTSKKYDTTMIEIKDDDGLSMVKFLEIDKNIYGINIKKFLKDLSVYILHHEKGGELKYSPGTISLTEGINLYYTCQTEPGSSGGPIINTNSLKVIGIHKGYSKLKKRNFGRLIIEPIKEFYELINRGCLPNRMQYKEYDNNKHIKKKNLIPEIQKNSQKATNKQKGELVGKLFFSQFDNYISLLNTMKNSSITNNISSNINEHSFTDFVNKECYICSKKINGEEYHEYNDNIILCLDCLVKISNLDQEKINIFHDHTLNLTYKNNNWICNECQKEYENKVSFYCQQCDLNVCVRCIYFCQEEKEQVTPLKVNDNFNYKNEQMKLITEDMNLNNDLISYHSLNYNEELFNQCQLCLSFIQGFPGYECKDCNIFFCLDCVYKCKKEGDNFYHLI